MATLSTSEQQLLKTIDNLNNSASKLTRATQSVTEALLDTSDKFKKARIEEEVAKVAKKWGQSVDKADGSLIKFVKSLNDQKQAFDGVRDSLKHLNSANVDSRKAFTENAKAFLKAAKENGNLQKALGKDYQTYHTSIEEFLKDGEKGQAEVLQMASILQGFGDKFAKTTQAATEELERLNAQNKQLSVKEALGDALQKRGGIVGAITDSVRGPNGMVSFINFLKSSAAELLIGGAEKAVRQLIDVTNEYNKTGVAPFLKSSALLLMQVTDLQKLMQSNKETIFAVQGGAETFNKTLLDLRSQTMKLAGMDPILSGKLGAAAQDVTTQLASQTLNYEKLHNRSVSYIKDLTMLSRRTSMTAEQVVEWDQQILNDQEIREALAKSTAEEREQVLKNIHRRVEEFQTMGIGIERAKQLAVAFEKLQKGATPVQRIRSSAQISVLGALIGMNPSDMRQLRHLELNKNKLTNEEQKKYQELTVQFGQQFQKRYNELDNSLNPLADAILKMSHDIGETSPNFKAVFDTSRIEGTISGGRARRSEEAQTSLDIKDGVTKAVIEAGQIASWTEQIFKFLSGNGLAALLTGLIALPLLSGLSKILGGLGGLAKVLTRGGGDILDEAEDVADNIGKGGKGGKGVGKGGKVGKLLKFGKLLGKGLALADAASGVFEEATEGPKTLSNFGGLDYVSPMSYGRLIGHGVNEGIEATTGTSVGSKVFDLLHPDDGKQATEIMHTGRKAAMAPPPAPAPAAPTAATAEAGTSDPMQALLVLVQQSKKVQEQIADAINALLKAYTDTEGLKLQKMLQTPNMNLAPARELPNG